MPTDQELLRQVRLLSAELDRRTERARLVRPYDEGGCRVPEAIERGRLTKAYRMLMPVAEAPWGSLIVDSVQDRLEVENIVDPDDEQVGKTLWELWQTNGMDSESKLAHRSALLDGRAHALVWPDPESGEVEISLDDCTQMVVQFREGSRRRRVAALRRFKNMDESSGATLFRPDGIWRFTRGPRDGSGTAPEWKLRPNGFVENPLEVVPVVELGVNGKLRPGWFPWAAGEFEHCIGLMDRINLLTFFGLVVALWQGFPLRGVIGERVLRDDDGNIIPPFGSKPDSVVQLENPDAKIFQLDPADRANLSIFPELEQLATISKTPKHYFPMGGGVANIAEPTIRAFEGALHAKVAGHKASLGEGWEEVARLAGLMLDEPVELSPRAQTKWKDHESRSLGERADAFVKIASVDGVPWLMAADLALDAAADDISRWQSAGLGTVLDELLRSPTPPPQIPPPQPQLAA